jgi:fused signal recognition particle receptor
MGLPGGLHLRLRCEIQRPVPRYVGTGERMTDLALFDATDVFVDALFARDA